MTRRAPVWLRSHVISYTGYHLNAAPLRGRLNVPSATVTLCLTWGAPLRLTPVREQHAVGGSRDAVMLGLQTGPVVGETWGTGHGVQVELTPLGAFALLRMPLRDLADAMIDPADVLGRLWGAPLREQLAAASGWVSRWAILDKAFGVRLTNAATPSPVVLEAWALLRESRGAMTVGELADITGRSRRRLEILFGEQIGLPPKSVARTLRFQNALTQAPAPGRTWAETAALCGYHDQAHLAREFRALTGLTATQFHALVTNGPAGDGSPVDGCITSVRTQ